MPSPIAMIRISSREKLSAIGGPRPTANVLNTDRWHNISTHTHAGRSDRAVTRLNVENLYILRALSRWPRGVVDVDGRGSGGRHHTGGKQRVDRRRAQIRCRRRWRERGQHGVWLTAGAPGGQTTIERIDGQSGRRASRRPKSSQNRAKRDFGS